MHASEKVSGTTREKVLAELIGQGLRNEVREARIDVVSHGFLQGEDACAVSRELSSFNQDLVRAVLGIFGRSHPWLAGCSWLEFGSGGRGEQVLSSDQDNGLIYPQIPDRHVLDDVAQDIVMTLDGAGLPLCPGGVMITSDLWRGTYDDWSKRLKTWLANPQEKGPWQYGLILDFRPLAGPKEPAVSLRQELWEYVRTRPLVLRLLAQELALYRTPLSIWGNFIVIRKGPFQGGLNIKKSGQVRLTTAARILALKYHLEDHHTLDRVHELGRLGHIGKRLETRLGRFWLWSQKKRLEIGLEEIRKGQEPHNVIFPYQMEREDVMLLKDGLHAVEKFCRLVLDGAGV